MSTITSTPNHRSADIVKLAVAGVGVGVASGLTSAAFLQLITLASDARADHRWLVLALPLWGLVFGLAVHRYAGRTAGGNRRTMTEITRFGGGVPFRMAPFAFAGTILTVLFGGSTGREGAALQMSAGITDGLGARLGVGPEDRRRLLIAALAGGFGSVFGVPYAGVVFALEVAPTDRRSRLTAAPACVVAAFVGHWTVLAVGVTHHHYAPFITSGVAASELVGWVIVCLALGLAAFIFPRVVEAVRHVLMRVSGHPAGRAALGGAAVAFIAVGFSAWAELGLSLPLLDDALAGHADLRSFLLKLVLVGLTLGSGFPGGEVTPTFVLGATLATTVAGWVDIPQRVAARLGFVALFGGAANAPVTAIVLGVELFGAKQLPLLVAGCVVARLCSGRHHIYEGLEEELFD